MTTPRLPRRSKKTGSTASGAILGLLGCGGMVRIGSGPDSGAAGAGRGAGAGDGAGGLDAGTALAGDRIGDGIDAHRKARTDHGAAIGPVAAGAAGKNDGGAEAGFGEEAGGPLAGDEDRIGRCVERCDEAAIFDEREGATAIAVGADGLKLR